MNIHEELALFKKRLDIELKLFLDREIALAKKQDHLVSLALIQAREILLSGGKRIRAAMMYIGYLAAGGKNTEEIIKASMSIELVHAFLLIHDDVMDRDDVRHGKKTIHAHFREYGIKYFPEKDTTHFGNIMAISIGDILTAYGGQCIFSSTFDPNDIVIALKRLQSIVLSTVIGQIKDVKMGFSSKIATEEEILLMYELKTARYTFEGPLCLGVTLAGGSQELLDDMKEYSIPMGIAYQIQDDILGIYGEETSVGKVMGSDLEEGKMTLLVAGAHQRGNKNQKKELKSLWGTTLTQEKLCRIQQLFKETGSFDYANNLQEELLQKARQVVQRMVTQDTYSRDFLFSVISYLAERKT
ncbi:MAG: polyprenyl synthetase family protein [Candidatus Moraniibacteriota bacterium]|nr:MAG: polyprenyl synthetase family protein [Candidatus Moranbacteria bacterium]